MPDNNTTEYFDDGFSTISGGMNSGAAPSLIPLTQLAFALNVTCRGGYITARPPVRKIALSFGSDSVLEARFVGGRWQGTEFYQPDSGIGSLLTAIGGRLYRVKINQTDAVVQEATISFAITTTAPFFAPAIGAVVAIAVSDTTNIGVGYEILIGGKNYVVTAITPTTAMVVRNVDDTPGTLRVSGTIINFWDLNPATRRQVWMQQAEKWMIVQDGQSVPIIYDGASSTRAVQGGSKPQISAGRMMAYWLGRLWWANPDEYHFRAGDQVYSSSGTPANRQRDAVLYQTQNTFLTSGDFSVPSNAGKIKAMKVMAVLDNSLGQGPLQVHTPSMVFSCTASADLTTWQTTNNPILGVSQFANGGLSQYSTVLANGDMIYRAVDGIRSLIMGRREFQTWGNVPQSRELNRILPFDQQDLLDFSSAIIFDNRLLMTAAPVPSDRGVYHRGVAVMDMDILSSLRGKEPSVYDGIWNGLKTLQFVKGTFGNTERAFAFTLTDQGTIELYEILKTGQGYFDNDTIPIIWTFETADFYRANAADPKKKKLLRLVDGEISIGELRGQADFQVFYRPDQSACWRFWRSFSVCATGCEPAEDPYECVVPSQDLPQYRTRLGFGEPSDECDPSTNKPFRVGYTFQVKVIVQGSVLIKALKVRSVQEPQSEFAPVLCQADCFTTV